jgi:Flp pilus assembly protein TadG
MKRHPLKRPVSNQDRRGAAVVEFALVAPLFFMLIFGIVEFGQAFMVSQLLNSAAREGTRVAIASGSTNAAVEAAVLDVLERSTTTDPADVTVAITVIPDGSNPDPANNVANAHKRDLITINVQVAFADVSLVTGKFLADVPLRGSCSMRHE